MKSWISAVLVALAALVATPAKADISTGLLAYYPFDGNLNDTSGNARNGTGNAVTFGPGRYGSAAVFDNATSTVTVASLANVVPGGNTPRSVGFWMFRTASDNGNMVAWGERINNRRFAALHEGNGALRVIGEFNDHTSTSIIPLNTFTHVAITYDGTTIRFYVNGVAAGTSAVGTPFNTNAANALRMGVNALPSNDEFFGGRLDEVRVYNRALSAADVTELFGFAPGTGAAQVVPALGTGSIALALLLLAAVGMLALRRTT